MLQFFTHLDGVAACGLGLSLQVLVGQFVSVPQVHLARSRFFLSPLDHMVSLVVLYFTPHNPH